MNKVGRPVNTDGIKARVLQTWINKDITRKEAIKCQALISLTKGISVTSVCGVLGVTRETVCEWRRRIKKEGVSYLERQSKRGRQSNLTKEISNIIKRSVLKSPEESGYRQAAWDGKLVCKLVKDKKDIDISVRTAQYWLKRIGFTKQRPRMKFKKANKKEKEQFKESIKKTS